MAAQQQLTGLNLYDYSDKELLYMVEELVDETGWTQTSALAEELGIDHDHPGQCVGTRLGYLRRAGLVDKNPDKPKQWRLTALGAMMKSGALTEGQQSQLEGMDPAKLLLTMRYMGSQYSELPMGCSLMMRREWQRATHMHKIVMPSAPKKRKK